MQVRPRAPHGHPLAHVGGPGPPPRTRHRMARGGGQGAGMAVAMEGDGPSYRCSPHPAPRNNHTWNIHNGASKQEGFLERGVPRKIPRNTITMPPPPRHQKAANDPPSGA